MLRFLREGVDESPFLFFLLVLLPVVVVLGYVIMVLGGHLNFPGQLAKIEQLREDVQKVSVAGSEDVIGQVTAWNQVIVSQHRYNKIWWADLTVPDEWDQVKTIEIP